MDPQYYGASSYVYCGSNPVNAAAEAIKVGERFGSGFLLQGIFGNTDLSNNYDNEMIKRAVNWAMNRYVIIGYDKWNSNAIVGKTCYSPSELSRPIK